VFPSGGEGHFSDVIVFEKIYEIHPEGHYSLNGKESVSSDLTLQLSRNKAYLEL